MRAFVCAAVLLSLAGAGPAFAQQRPSSEDWRTYDGGNGLSLQYPAGLFSRDEGASERGAGKKLTTPDGRALLAFFVMDNAERHTPRSYLARNLLVDARSLIYRRVTERFFVVSSIRDNNIFYSRCNFGSRVRCVHIEYPASEKRAFDHIVTRISHTLS